MEISEQIIELYLGVGKELKKIERDNYIINSISCEVREIVREELEKK